MVESRSSKKTSQLGNNKDDHQNRRKFCSRFLFKALLLTVLCAVVPVFLSQNPELANQTRLLELLHLVFVGIAVSYGLFSRCNNNREGSSHNDHKADHNPNAYVPKILEVSSVFNVGHESESEPSDDYSGDYSKIQTWRNRHHLKIPDILVSNDQQTRFVDGLSSEDREKPLLLPVRSLNHSRVTDSGEHPDRWEKVRSKRQLLKSLGDDNSDVLPSPIPWRSRSSSTEIESQPFVKSVESQPLTKTPTNLSSSVSSPRKSLPLPEFVAKSAEDIARRHNFHDELHPPPSPPPPPPPPPPLPAFYNSPSRKDRYRIESREAAQKMKLADREFHPPPPPPPPPPADYYKSSTAKLRVSNERRKSSEQKAKSDERSSKRNSTRKVWWSDPVVESKEPRIVKQETEKDSYLGSKVEESEDIQEKRRLGNEDDEMKDKKIDEEGVSGSDVDKKADEFIAKFREQIRLQRIESIKRSASKISSANSTSR